jgi:hypothetical protein
MKTSRRNKHLASHVRAENKFIFANVSNIHFYCADFENK